MREMAAAMAAGGNGAFSASDPAAAAATPAESGKPAPVPVGSFDSMLKPHNSWKATAG
jgi:hypothetical protein